MQPNQSYGRRGTQSDGLGEISAIDSTYQWHLGLIVWHIYIPLPRIPLFEIVELSAYENDQGIGARYKSVIRNNDRNDQTEPTFNLSLSTRIRRYERR